MLEAAESLNVVDHSVSVLQSGSTQHVMIGVQLLSQLVCEMNQVSEVSIKGQCMLSTVRPKKLINSFSGTLKAHLSHRRINLFYSLLLRNIHIVSFLFFSFIETITTTYILHQCVYFSDIYHVYATCTNCEGQLYHIEIQ